MGGGVRQGDEDDPPEHHLHGGQQEQPRHLPGETQPAEPPGGERGRGAGEQRTPGLGVLGEGRRVVTRGEVRAAADDGPRGGLPLQTPGGAQPDVSERQSRVRDHRVRRKLRRDHRRGAVRA